MPGARTLDGMGSPGGPQPGRAERLAAAVERDGPACVWCGRECAVTDPTTTRPPRAPRGAAAPRRINNLVRGTTDHLVPKVKGGPSWLENEVLACSRCNRQRGHASPADWLAECGRRGWTADAGAVLRALRALEAAIAERGGQRRARPYLAAQLRRLERAAAA
jgi:hypothetical protein